MTLPPTLTHQAFIYQMKQAVCSLKDENGKTHYLVKHDITKDPSGRSCCKKWKCKLCYEGGKWRDVSYYCISCGDGFSFCNRGDGQDCFKAHVEQIRHNTCHSADSKAFCSWCWNKIVIRNNTRSIKSEHFLRSMPPENVLRAWFFFLHKIANLLEAVSPQPFQIMNHDQKRQFL